MDQLQRVKLIEHIKQMTKETIGAIMTPLWYRGVCHYAAPDCGDYRQPKGCKRDRQCEWEAECLLLEHNYQEIQPAENTMRINIIEQCFKEDLELKAAKNAPNDREKSIKSTMVLPYSVHPWPHRPLGDTWDRMTWWCPDTVSTTFKSLLSETFFPVRVAFMPPK